MATARSDFRLPGRVLTVVIRDDGPLSFDDCPSYRSVRLELTENQRQMLALRQFGYCGGQPQYEEISRCFIEPETEEEK